MNKTSSDEFIGFDLGHGETALGRAFGATIREPEILEYRSKRSFVTAVAKTKAGVKIGGEAVSRDQTAHTVIFKNSYWRPSRRRYYSRSQRESFYRRLSVRLGRNNAAGLPTPI